MVLLGAQHAERNESTKPPIGGVGFADEGGRHGYFLQWPGCTPHECTMEQLSSTYVGTAAGISQTQSAKAGGSILTVKELL